MAGKAAANLALAGVFSAGSWPQERHDLYQSAVDRIRKLPTCQRLPRTNDVNSLKGAAQAAIRRFLKGLPTWDTPHGIAAWHEPDTNVVKWLQTLNGAFGGEILRRLATMDTSRSFRVRFDIPIACRQTARQKKHSSVTWHVIVPAACDLAGLQAKISAAGETYPDPTIADLLGRLCFGGPFRVGQMSAKAVRGHTPKLMYDMRIQWRSSQAATAFMTFG